jgi:calcium and integrin-binding protein 1
MRRQTMSFQEFLTMLNCFSPRTSFDIKAKWAFRLYDFNKDNFIDTDDLEQLLYLTLTKTRMNKRLRMMVVQQVFNEADLDGNNKLTKTEFNRVLRRLPDFVVKFQFAIQFE